MLKEPLSEKRFFVPRGLIPCRTTFKFEYLREFEPEFKIVLGYESRAYMAPIHEKTRGQKSHATVHLRVHFCTMLETVNFATVSISGYLNTVLSNYRFRVNS
jgi:hypothetical protein